MRVAIPFNLLGAQRAPLEQHIPVFDVGRPRVVDMREALNAILDLKRASGGTGPAASPGSEGRVRSSPPGR